jgi:hypothetical protein
LIAAGRGSLSCSWRALAGREITPDAGNAPRPNASAAEIDDLSVLLDSRNLAALDKFALLSPSLCELLGPVRFDRLSGAVEKMDFPLAARLLGASRWVTAASS